MGFFSPQRWGPVCSERKKTGDTKSNKKADAGLNGDLSNHNQVIDSCLAPGIDRAFCHYQPGAVCLIAYP